MAEPLTHSPDWQEILVCLRQIMRATDLHSKQVRKACGLTLPQVMLLRAISAQGDVTVRKLARDISLSQPTVTTILDRLEEKGLVERVRSLHDRRIVNARLTQQGKTMLGIAPPLLDERFMQRFADLPGDEQHALQDALVKIVRLLDQEQE